MMAHQDRPHQQELTPPKTPQRKGSGPQSKTQEPCELPQQGGPQSKTQEPCELPQQRGPQSKEPSKHPKQEGQKKAMPAAGLACDGPTAVKGAKQASKAGRSKESNARSRTGLRWPVKRKQCPQQDWPAMARDSGLQESPGKRARGLVTQRVLVKSMQLYAEQVGKDGFWLDWLDAVLFAENNDKKLGMISYSRDPGTKLQIIAASDQLKEVPGFSDVQANHSIDRSEDTWVILSCNAGFDQAASANHWIPCVFKEHVPPSTYVELVDQQMANLKVKIAQLQSELLDVELEDDEGAQEQLKSSIHEEINAQLASGISENHQSLRIFNTYCSNM
eukprot:s835_g4.t1